MFTNVCRASSWLLRGPVPGCGARPLPEVASLAAEHGQDGLRASLAIACRLTSCGTQAQLLRSRWDLPGSGIEPLSLELARQILYHWAASLCFKVCCGTLREKVRVGWSERTASKHVYYLGWNRSPAQVGCMRQALRAGALGRLRGIRWRGKREGGSGWEILVNPWLMHVNVWQKLLQYCN